MTKSQLAFAQYLHGVWERGHYFLRQRGIAAKDALREDTERGILGIAGSAKGLFVELTGRMPHEVESHELNTVTPAPWTKLAGKEVYPKTQPEVLSPPPDGQDVGKVRATNNTGDGQ